VTVRTGMPIWVVLMALMAPALPGQKSAPPSTPQPAPQISGRLLDTDGSRLTVGYWVAQRLETFTAKIHSTCMLPASTKSGMSKPMDLATIPRGTSMTLFFVSRPVGKRIQNTVLAIRFDVVPSGSALPEGISIPCFKATGPTGR
jgi:hypothetical protein